MTIYLPPDKTVPALDRFARWPATYVSIQAAGGNRHLIHFQSQQWKPLPDAAESPGISFFLRADRSRRPASRAVAIRSMCSEIRRLRIPLPAGEVWRSDVCHRLTLSASADSSSAPF